MNKQETLQLRIDGKLKADFYKKAEERGESPSEYIRFLMDLAVKDKIRVGDQLNGMNQTLMALIQILFQASYKQKDNSLFEALANDTNLFFLYRELAYEFAASGSPQSETDTERIVNHQVFDKLGIKDWESDPKFKHSYPGYADFKAIREKQQKN